jgi:NADH-quinone oxidoreductase subunit G
MGETVTLTIDERRIDAARGTVVIEAARQAGIDIPHYCYHPYLSVAGNCRMCLIEIEKAPKLQIACSTQVAEGMVVRTRSSMVLEARTGVMEFLLINHPLDCPICDQAGECRLQEYSLAHGRGYSRFEHDKLEGRKNVDLGRHIVFDEERCIKCTRCVRFCDEVSRTGELALFNRGDEAIIGVFPGRRLDNPYSGNTVDICPVGALTLKEFRFRSRVWFLEQGPSICPGCARGCNITVWANQDRIHRFTPRENPQVNKVWMCDEGRLSYLPLVTRERLLDPVMDGEPVRWRDAIERTANLLGGVRERAPRVGVVASPRATIEDLALLRRLCEATSASDGLPKFERGEDDDLLIRKDKTPNRTGARLLGFERPAAEVLEAAAQGKIDVLYVMDEEIFGAAADPEETRLARQAAGRVRSLIVHGSFRDRVPKGATVVLPAAVFGEYEGTFVNFEGRAQRVHALLRRPGRSRTHLAILGALERAAGWGEWSDDPARAWKEAQALAAPLASLGYGEVGSAGVLVGRKRGHA